MSIRKCEDCKIILEDDTRYCPGCGKAVAPDKRPVTSTSAEVGALLASANLHRIRSEWDAAVADATEALKIDPENPDIASLLGDIYEQQGKLSDAVIWYEMATELNPHNQDDIMKLEHAKQHLANQRKHKTDSFGVFQRRTRLWATVLGGAFVLMVILALVVVFRGGSEETSTSVINESPSAVSLSAGNSSTLSPEAQRKSIPSSGSADLSGVPSGTSGLRTKAEVEIRDKISGAQAVQQSRAQVESVLADPRHSVAVVTFSMPSDGSLTKAQVIQAAGAIAEATFEAHKQVQFVTARCIISSGSVDSTQIAFVGDIARSSFEGVSGTPTVEQLQEWITNPFWNPALQ